MILLENAVFFNLVILSSGQDLLGCLKIFPSKKKNVNILKDVSGIVKPSR